MPEFEDFYEILQVHFSAEPEVIQKAYMALANKYHPDKNPSAAAAAKMRKINYAYDVLRDPVKRKQYDAEWTSRRQAAKAAESKPKPVAEPPFIKFTGVKPGSIQRSSFVIRNAGGSYRKIWLSNPDSWVKVIGYASLTESDELPMKVDLEAIGSQRNSDYTEFITIRLDDEETRVRIDLSTRTATADSSTAWSEVRSLFSSSLVKVAAGVVIIALAAYVIFGLIPSLTKGGEAKPSASEMPPVSTPAASSPSSTPAAVVPSPSEAVPTAPSGVVTTPSTSWETSSTGEQSQQQTTTSRILFNEVDLSPIANYSAGISGFPGGERVFLGIPFNLAENRVFMTQDGAASLPVEAALDVYISYPQEMYILINTAHTYLESMGRDAGRITLVFDNGATEETALTVGQNIREYTIDPTLVNAVTDSASQEVWQGGKNPQFVIDMLTIRIGADNREHALKQIVIADLSQTSVGSREPGLIVWGLTVAQLE